MAAGSGGPVVTASESGKPAVEAAGSGQVAAPEPVAEAPALEALEWRVAPWRREPLKAAIAAGIILAAVAGSYWYSGREIFMALLALLIMWGTLGPFFVTTRYVIDGEGVEIDSAFLKRRRKWAEIRSYYTDRKGATLSPFARHTWLESYRSMRILFGDCETEVRKLLNEKLGEAART